SPSQEYALLKLKKLQILGFKSFCDRTELHFHGEGVAAIVGPNGCGKSNISDAISWVLGEQSAKTLRGSRMEDVIFAGTRDRKPTGMAEVSLTLIDPDVYSGADLNSATEIDVQDEIPDHASDWDEAAVRADAQQETERYAAEVQPGPEEFIKEGATATDPDAILETGPEQPAAAATEAASAEAPPQVGTPQVVLKIRRRNFKTREFKAGEIVVTRRLFRTGLGPESYAIIEQGRIGQILSSRPHDRRAIIEEAAGITKFKTRKRLAEGRLEQARQNLARVNDIFDEVTRQMNSLKRQAAKA